jgi:electron transfer flavoprotein alpha subunit
MNSVSESKIWVVIEVRNGMLTEVGLEIIGKALALAEPVGWKVAALIIGHNLSRLPDDVLNYGVDEVLVADHPLLAEYCNQAFVKAIEPHVAAGRPEVILLGATAMGVDLGPRLAARLRTGLSAHCVDLELTPDGELLAVVPGWGGSLMAKIACPKARPQMATVKPGTFPLPETKKPQGRKMELEVALEGSDVTYNVVQVDLKEVKADALESADVVLAGGWGVGDKKGWQLIEELAEALKGAVGATRPAVDEGWADESQMIGTSGRTVRPKLYVAVALAGHAHHMVGIKSPELSVGINKDPKAAIFEHCDYALVGDYREIVPALIRELKSRSRAAKD